jgi:hypothetical protein
VRRPEQTKQKKRCNHLHYKMYLTQNIQRIHGLDVPGIDYLLARDLLHPSRPVLGLIQPSTQCVPGHSRG